MVTRKRTGGDKEADRKRGADEEADRTRDGDEERTGREVVTRSGQVVTTRQTGREVVTRSGQVVTRKRTGREVVTRSGEGRSGRKECPVNPFPQQTAQC